MEDEKFLHCYKMVWDTEFAPNPHHGVLTLATCKPRIRKYAEVGDWISGWTAVRVHDKNNKIHQFPDKEKLIYLAKVTKKIKYKDYWKEYTDKRPHPLEDVEPISSTDKKGKKEYDETRYDSGDNIYEPDKDNKDQFIQKRNGGGHGNRDKEHDLKGEYILICEEFYYFGVNHACEIPDQISPRPIPRWKKVSSTDDKIESFINFIKDHYKSGIITNNENTTK